MKHSLYAILLMGILTGCQSTSSKADYGGVINPTASKCSDKKIKKPSFPIVRVEPRYPKQAARDGVEGYVKFEYAIDKTGSPSIITAVESFPGDTFVEEATRALRKWKYKPLMGKNGRYFSKCHATVIEFKLD